MGMKDISYSLSIYTNSISLYLLSNLPESMQFTWKRIEPDALCSVEVMSVKMLPILKKKTTECFLHVHQFAAVLYYLWNICDGISGTILHSKNLAFPSSQRGASTADITNDA